MPFKVDPQEKDLNLKPIFEEVNKRLDEQFKDNHYLGMCHEVWKTKKKILKEEYNIDWKSPAEMNPYCMFD